jgi:hypothetical protein
MLMALLSSACASPSRARPASTIDVRVPSAQIADDFAQFVFPSQRHSPWVKPVAAERYPGQEEHYHWEVRWPERNPGYDPQSITVILRWRTLQPPQGPLAAMVDAADIEVLTVCRECYELPALSPSRERIFKKPAISARMQEGAVVVTVRGRAAISRLFPLRPDSVWLSIYPPDSEIVDTTIAVIKR